METSQSESPSSENESPWYIKIFEYIHNRNRVSPGKVELPECDFFMVAPKRTLRVLRPSLQSELYYENSQNDKPESSLNDNFFIRWSKRPHSSGNCRCSFRQSNRLSTTEEKIITEEINRIRTSLCEAELTGENIEKLEERFSGLQNLRVSSTEADPEVDGKKKAEAFKAEIDEKLVKNKIIQDLEKYINVLLEEILSDTIKFISDAEAIKEKKSREKNGEKVDFNISFQFHSEGDEAGKDAGYVNRGFVGSNIDPDSLEFCLQSPVTSNKITMEKFDCVDSGINSVETVELQQEQEPSLEQSLMQIIDEKLGRTPLESSLEDLTNVESREKTFADVEIVAEGEPRVSEDLEGEETKIKEDLNLKEKRKEGEEKRDEGRRRVVEDNERRNLGESQADRKNVGLQKMKLNEIRVLENSEDTIKRKKRAAEVEEKAAKNYEKLEKHLGRANMEKHLQDTLKRLKDENQNKDDKMVDQLQDDKEIDFDKLRLEFKESDDTSSRPHLSFFKKKIFCFKSSKGDESTEKGALKDKEVKIKQVEARGDGKPEAVNPKDFVMFRRNRKPMIVFLHGFGSSAEVFDYQLEYFSSLGYPCIAPEMLGHGMSSAPNSSRDYHFNKLLKDLDVILHHYAFEPGRKCVLVAHNYGCSFATALACKYDTNIHQLVLISGGGPTPLAPPSTESTLRSCCRGLLTPLLMCGLHRDILYSARGRQHPYCGSEPPEQWPSHMKYVLEGMIWPEGDYVFHRRICTPTLLIHGLRDNKVSLVQECQMERTMVKAFLEALPAAGRTPMTDCPDQLNHMIHCFIDLWKNKKW